MANKDTRCITLRVYKNILKQIDEAAKSEHRTRTSYLINLAMEDMAKKQEEKEKKKEEEKKE